VVVEVNTAQQIRIIPEDIKKLARFEIVLVFTKVGPKIHKDFCTVLPYVRHLKFVDEERIVWIPMNQLHTTFLSDLTYKDDREVEI
jgi:hypothetical protein